MKAYTDYRVIKSCEIAVEALEFQRKLNRSLEDRLIQMLKI